LTIESDDRPPAVRGLATPDSLDYSVAFVEQFVDLTTRRLPAVHWLPSKWRRLGLASGVVQSQTRRAQLKSEAAQHHQDHGA
jgi:hypothetical protein